MVSFCLAPPLANASAAIPDHQAALNAWAKAKGWIRHESGYKSNDRGDFYIAIPDDPSRKKWFETLQPHDKSRTDSGIVYVDICNHITVAGGLPAVRFYKLINRPETKDALGYRIEDWEYYCPEYWVLIRASRNTQTGMEGSDPLSIIEGYIAFAKMYLSPEVGMQADLYIGPEFIHLWLPRHWRAMSRVCPCRKGFL